MRRAGHVARIEEVKNVLRNLVGRFEGEGNIGRPRRKWEDKIKMGHREMGFGLSIGFIWLRIGTGGELL
jgi:hypothetical protein